MATAYPSPVGYSGATGSAAYGPTGWEYTAPELTPEQTQEQQRRAGLATLYRGYSENIPQAESDYYRSLAGDVAQQQYGDLNKQYGQTMRASNQDLINRGIMGSATGQRQSDIDTNYDRSSLGIATQAQGYENQLGEQARQQYQGLAGYYDQMQQQGFLNQQANEQATMNPAYQGTNALTGAYGIEQGMQQPEQDYLTPFLGSVGGMAGSYLGGMTGSPFASGSNTSKAPAGVFKDTTFRN